MSRVQMSLMQMSLVRESLMQMILVRENLVQMNLIQMSLSGAVMILMIAVIRALFINKLPKKAFLALWGVVEARLLIPYSFRSAFSIYSLLGQLAAAGEAINDSLPVLFAPIVPVQNMMSAPGDAVSNATAGAGGPWIIGRVAGAIDSWVAERTAGAADLWVIDKASGAVDSWGAVWAAVTENPWAVVWAAGALVCAAFFAAAYWKCRREFNASLPVDNGNAYVKAWLSEHRIYRPIEIRQSGRISAPLTYGVFRPVILMPKTTDWDDQDTLKYVLTHEYVHIRRFDAVAKLVFTAVFCIHWFNPAVWLLYVLANRDIELSCDEAVIRRFGEHAKSAYAMALIRMEETRSGLAPLCNNFSKNAIEERITAIMKIKKTSPAALIASAALVIGVTTAFATSAQVAGNASTARFTTSAPAVGNASTARFATSEVEWWTYDEYKAWLENEKVELQGMIGQKAWTGSRGEFVWTQEIVDETVAMYEDVLENIKNGMLYSKTIDGEAAFCTLPSGTDTETEVQEGDAAASDFTIYEPYGLTWDERENALFWNGQRVRYFLDGADLDGAGAMAVRFEYLDAEFAGEIDVHTVRRRVQNDDGSFDPQGPLTGLEKYSQEEYDFNTNTLRVAAAQEAVSAGSTVSEDASVGSAVSEDNSEWSAVSEADSVGTAVSGTVALENVAGEISAAEGNAAAPGTGFDEIFEKYAPFGIIYEEAEGNSGRGNVYYNGQLVSRFADQTPDGGAFTFTSAEQGSLTVKTVYDDDGRLTGVEVVSD